LLHSWAVVAGWVRWPSWFCFVDWFKSFFWIIGNKFLLIWPICLILFL
jgi:hypothetical protein